MWSVEPIPPEHKLFFRAHDCFIRNGTLLPGVFREQGDSDEKGMSTDWEKYSTAEDSKARSKQPSKNSIGSFIVRDLLEIGLRVIHAPLETPEIKNRAHTNVHDVEGENETQNRLLLLQRFQWEIRSELASR